MKTDNNLVKIERGILLGTPYAGQPLRNLQANELKKEIFNALAVAYNMSGTKKIEGFEQKLQLQTEIIYDNIIEEHGGITLPELARCLKRGFMGAYGDYYGVTPLSVASFLKAYKNSGEREKLVRQSKALENQQKPKQIETSMTEAEKIEFWNKSKTEYKKSKTVLGEAYLFKLGCELGYIDLKDEMFFEEVKFLAVKHFERTLKDLRLNGGLLKKPMIAMVQEVLRATETERKKKQLWRNRCKSIAVQLTFKNG